MSNALPTLRWPLWKLALVACVIGPLPATLFVVSPVIAILPEQPERAAVVCGIFGALYGLSIGLISQRFALALVGLNAGAGLGFATGAVVNNDELNSALRNFLGWRDTELLVLLLSAAVFGGLLRVEWVRGRWLRTLARGFLVSAIAGAAWVVSFQLIAVNHRFPMSVRLGTALFVGPFTAWVLFLRFFFPWECAAGGKINE